MYYFGMKGVLLAAGTGSRLLPSTLGTSKHLLQVYDKPLIYYPLSTLLMTGVREIAIIINAEDKANYQALLGDGSKFGCRITLLIQNEPLGIADGLRVAEDYSSGDSICLVLGDNIFHGSGVGLSLKNVYEHKGALIFSKKVANPSAYGTITVDEFGRPVLIEEKPEDTQGKLAIPGIYFFDSSVFRRIDLLEPSGRGELEITDLLKSYLSSDELRVLGLDRGTAWMDAGTTENLWLAGEYVRAFQSRQDQLISSPEEIALRIGNISSNQLRVLAEPLRKTTYGERLLAIAEGY